MEKQNKTKQLSKARKENKIFSQSHSTYKTFCSNAPSNGTKGHEKLGFNTNTHCHKTANQTSVHSFLTSGPSI